MQGIHHITGKENINTKAFWDNCCLTNQTNNGTSALESIMEWLKQNHVITKDTTVLDIGSGPHKPGSFVTQILATYGCKCFVIDISSEICKTWDKTGVIATTSELPRLEFADKQFDIILCSHVLEHIDDIKACLDEIRRISNGIIITNTPVGQSWCSEPAHVWWMDSSINYGIGQIIASFPGNQHSSLVQVYKNIF